MNLDQRLHHAARELREVHIETPPLTGRPAIIERSSSLRRIPALVAPVLFAIGGLVMVSGSLRSETSRLESPPAGGTAITADATDATITDVPSPIEELRLITSLVAHIDPPSHSPAERPVVRPGPIGVV